MLITRWLLLIAVAASCTFSQEDDSELKISAWGWLTFGRVGSGQNMRKPGNGESDVDFSKEWLSDYQAGIKVLKNFDDQTNARVHLGISTAFLLWDPSTSGLGANVEYQVRRFVPYLIEAAIGHTVELDNDAKFQIEFGYLPLKYNSQALNLGEYLVRSMAYPTVVESGFELSDKVKITGLHFGYSFNYGDQSSVKLDNYTYTGMYMFPTYDISSTFLASVNHEKIVELGAGVELHNVISVKGTATTPGSDTAVKFRSRFMMYVSPTDSLNPIADTTIYTTKAVKAMGRVTFNPLTLFGLNGEDGMFGDEDLKLFAEVAILGIKNYPGWFQHMNERMPVMFGMNLPTFKFLDVMSLQLQYLQSKYWNTYESFLQSSAIVPYRGSSQEFPTYEKFMEDSTNFKTHDDWKWSLYMSKKVSNRMKFSLQFANDNLFKTNYMPPPPTPRKYTEIMGDTWVRERIITIDPETEKTVVTLGKEKWGVIKDWYWMARITFFL